MNPVTIITGLLAALGPLLFLLVVLGALGGLTVLAFRLLVLREFFGGIWDLFKELFALVIPKQWDSARTLLMLGAFSWLVSVFVGRTTQSIIAFIGWFFLIGGIHWIIHAEKDLKAILTINGFFIGPWITGGLICYFLFGTTEGVPGIAYIVWPCVSAVLAGLPRFIGSDSKTQVPIWIKPKPLDRQYLVNLALINLLLSCWIQLLFTTQNWVTDYPTLQMENVSNSAFVIQTQSPEQLSSRGIEILSRTEAELKANLQGQSWSQVERWLLDFNQQMQRVDQTVLNQLNPMKENAYWQVAGKILPGEYNVQLYSIWNGPTADTAGFHYTQTCQITRVAPTDLAGLSSASATTAPQVGNARVQCSPMQGPIRGQPEGAGQ
jgi:hypothetical protein